MSKTIEPKPKRHRKANRGSRRRIILLEPVARKRLGKALSEYQPVTLCKAADVRRVLSQVSRESLWISPGSQTTDTLLRNLIALCASHHGRRSRLGGILMLEPPRSRAISTLHSLFEKVIGESPSLKLLPDDQLASVLCAPVEEAADLFVGGVVDTASGTLALVRGNLETLGVPLAMFRPSGVTRPDFRRFEVDDYGHTLRFGDYEAAADAILYETDASYRKRINSQRRAEEKGFGPSLRRLRLQRGLARDQFPGIAAKTIARLERGEVGKPQGRTLRTIAETLEVEPELIETF